MNKVVIILLIYTFSLANNSTKGFIDMHGGKSNSLTQKKVDFAIKSIDYLLHNKSKDLNKTKIKFIKIDDIDSF